MRESSAHLFSCFNENVFNDKDIMGRVKSYISRNKSELNSSLFETNKKNWLMGLWGYGNFWEALLYNNKAIVIRLLFNTWIMKQESRK